ncbi:hypothetical protein ABID08_000362 [Rhizobium binae]|uniref:Uncharacterized protein n=1 Tax=Rhizobium binae TaxID=1138190 RepID=A0ABV2M973_9HYPH
MQPIIGRLPDLLQEQGGIAAGLTPDIFWLQP